MSEDINMDEMWNEYHENVLRQWGEASACYRYMHHRAFLMYKKLSLRFSLPVIVLSTITGTANFAQSSFPVSIQGGVPAVIGGMNLIAGLIATIMQFLKINELMENHRTSALGHGGLSRNIRLQLALPRVERSKEGLIFVNECKGIYESLLEQSPPIPKEILKTFEKDYPIEGVFTKPEILNVRPIPLLKMPKTIEPIRAITKNTPFEKVGDYLAPPIEEEEEEEEEEFMEEEEGGEVEEETDVEQGTPKE
jgi:hypothetical protein